MQESEFEEVGLVVGKSDNNRFFYATDIDYSPMLWEYVMAHANGKEVLGQIDGVYSLSELMTEKLDLKSLKKLVTANINDAKLYCSVKILGYLEGTKISIPRSVVMPGQKVYKAPDSVLSRFYAYPEEEGLHIGTLATRVTVPVSVSVNGLRRHLAILAQTGAGKSHTASIIIEELLKKGATVLVLDPHADYVFLSQKKDGKRFSDRVQVFQNPYSTGRYGKEEIGNVAEFTIRFSDLDVDQIRELAGISENWTNLATLLKETIESVKKNQSEFDLNTLKEHSRADPDSAQLLKYLDRIDRFKKVFGPVTTDITKILKPKQVSVIDLSGLDGSLVDYIAYSIITQTYNRLINRNFEYPIFLVVEEAHTFIPKEGYTRCTGILKKLAAEGRKFGMFLILITQRPSKINADILSQCNSQIIMRVTNPKDQESITQSAEQMSESLMQDLPGLNVGEAIAVGAFTKVPILVKIKERETREGGGDIDVVEKLKEANSVKESSNSELRERLKRTTYKE